MFRVGVRVEEKEVEERSEIFSKTVSLLFEDIIRIFVRPETTCVCSYIKCQIAVLQRIGILHA